MTKDENSQNNGNDQGNWLSTALEGGLPQIIAGPAGKAISRLIGHGVDIPAAWLEGFAQSSRDKTEARSQVSKAIAEKAAEMAVDEPAIMERALHGMLAKSYRTQTNREAVAAIALEELTKLPPPEVSKGPSDDWINKFERHAEDASGEEIRTMFGRLLAEEVRQPGTISSASLRFVSDLDSDVAKIIQRVLPFSNLQGNAFLELIDPELTLPEMMLVEQAGFWTIDPNMRFEFKSNDSPKKYIILRSNLAAEIALKDGGTLSLKCAFLSKPGRDLLSVTETQFDFAAFAKVVQMKPGVDSVKARPCIMTPNGWEISNLEVQFEAK